MAVEQDSRDQAFCSVIYDRGAPIFEVNRGFRSVELLTTPPGPTAGMCILKPDPVGSFSRVESIFTAHAQSDLVAMIGYEATSQWFVAPNGELCILVVTTNCAGSGPAPFSVQVKRIN